MALMNFAIDISKTEREEFKRLAKSRGMTMQGLLGQLVKKELLDETPKPAGQGITKETSIWNGTLAIGDAGEK